jgi:hypothetical protein
VKRGTQRLLLVSRQKLEHGPLMQPHAKHRSPIGHDGKTVSQSQSSIERGSEAFSGLRIQRRIRHDE